MHRTILIVDDSPGVRHKIRSALVRSDVCDDVIEAGDGLTAFRIALARRPVMALCDLVMPRWDGLKFLALRASSPTLATLPVIMLTAEDDVNRKAEILDHGAADYVVKPFHEKDLLARVRVHLRLQALQTELRAANTTLAALATTDPLTGLANRRHVERVMADELAVATQALAPLSVVLADIDHFKQVNDVHGHAMGDEVLRNVGRIFPGLVRRTDTVARYGGEEFLVVLPNTTPAGAVQLAERLRLELAAANHEHDGHRLRRTASFGVASWEAAGGAVTAEVLLRRADEALYRAKHGGRNRVVLWNRAGFVAATG